MSGHKNNEKSGIEKADGAGSVDALWRKPITLDSFEDEDPLETLYRGREVNDPVNEAAQKPDEKTEESAAESSQILRVAASPKAKKTVFPKNSEMLKNLNAEASKKKQPAPSTKITEDKLKSILKIKSDSFCFTDIREILRGKSFDIYAYLRFLSGNEGVCKIKHLDMMKKLDISRPTLFKQADWLVRLSLIEKRSVPGDHLGTSYTVYPLEDVLPIPETLIAQIQAAIEDFGANDD